MRKLNLLLSRLREINVSNNFKAYDREVESDVSYIYKMQERRDVEGLIEFWKDAVEKPYFELMHPEKIVKTRAIYSSQHGMANFVLLADEFYKNFWILAQCELLVNLVITENNAYKNSYGNITPITNQLQNFINELDKVDCSIFNYKYTQFGFNLSQRRPYHHFYDNLKFLLCFNIKPVANRESFLTPNKDNNTISKNMVFLFPTVIGNNYINKIESKVISRLNLNMENFVFKSSIAFKEPYVDVANTSSNNNISIWLGITGQKRSWLQQVEGYVKIAKKLSRNFGKTIVYIDGITAMEGRRLANEEDNAVFREIENAFSSNENIEITSLIGMDYREKIAICDTVDLFIANAGTGCMVPLRFVRKPGVLHSNTKLFTFPDDYPDSVKITSKDLTIDVADGDNKRGDYLSYHIPWQHVFNLTAEVINEIKGTDIKPLVVPAVEEVARKYETMEKRKEEGLQAFNALNDKLRPNHKAPDILRDVAIAFEQSGDIDTAFKVMEKAHLLRPKGPLIKRKLDEYRQILAEQK